jgi:hypothetical protein
VVIWLAVVLLFVGFALIVPRGSLPGTTSQRNVRLFGQSVERTPGYQGDLRDRTALKIRLVGVVLLVAAVVIIAVS